ncbi:MAG TPA: hypothetical protein VJ044_19495 [Candidatus Hodarchaeales archaeon]|nr:hypothetical protein [Candidatus Hodarchaeales archaeon]
MNWLLDSTYILPYFGIEVKIPGLRDTLRGLLKSGTRDFAITTCSLLEGKRKANREYLRKGDSRYLKRANSALLAFDKGSIIDIIEPWFTPRASYWADALLVSGHKDYIDCWIAGTAKALRLTLVTEDKSLVELLRSLEGWESLKACSWEEMLKDSQYEL